MKKFALIYTEIHSFRSEMPKFLFLQLVIHNSASTVNYVIPIPVITSQFISTILLFLHFIILW